MEIQQEDIAHTSAFERKHRLKNSDTVHLSDSIIMNWKEAWDKNKKAVGRKPIWKSTENKTAHFWLCQ